MKFCFFFAFFWLSKILTYFSPKNKWGDCHERYYFYIGFEIIVVWRKKICNEPSKLWFLFFFDKTSVSKFSDFQKLKKKKKKNEKIFQPFFFWYVKRIKILTFFLSSFDLQCTPPPFVNPCLPSPSSIQGRVFQIPTLKLTHKIISYCK